MAWARLDDRYDDNRKIRRVWRRDARAVGVHVMAITYCARHETDGLVDLDWMEETLPVAAERETTIGLLVEAGLVTRVPAGVVKTLVDGDGNDVTVGPLDDEAFLVNDFLDYNPSSVRLSSRRAQDRVRKMSSRTGTSVRAESDDRSPPFQPDSPNIPPDNGDIQPETPDIPRARVCAPAPAGAGPGRAQQTDQEGGAVDARTRTRKVDPDSLPSDFPPQLAAVVGHALEVLLRVQAERGGDLPTVRGVALAIRRFADRDHLRVAGELEQWSTAGNGSNRPVRDWARQYTAFLERAPAGSPTRASAGDERQKRRARGAEALSSLLSSTTGATA